jgi:hypothetical protein
MAKISKDTMEQRLIDLYAEDTQVRDAVFKGTKAELLRLNNEFGTPGSEADHEFWGTTDEKYQRFPYPTFQRLMRMFYAQRGYDWVRESYKDNFKKVAA